MGRVGHVNPDYESRFLAHFDEGSEAQSEGCLGRSGSLGGMGQLSKTMYDIKQNSPTHTTRHNKSTKVLHRRQEREG